MIHATLLLAACLVAKPHICQSFEVPVETCAMPYLVMQAALLWAAQHPDWALQRTEGCVNGSPT